MNSYSFNLLERFFIFINKGYQCHTLSMCREKLVSDHKFKQKWYNSGAGLQVKIYISLSQTNSPGVLPDQKIKHSWVTNPFIFNFNPFPRRLVQARQLIKHVPKYLGIVKFQLHHFKSWPPKILLSRAV